MNQASEWWKSAKDKRDDKGKQKKKSQAHAAITEDSTDSGSESCALLHEDPKCSVDWNNTLASTIDRNATLFTLPFLLDSGTTSHCSPHHEDFFQMTPIPA